MTERPDRSRGSLLERSFGLDTRSLAVFRISISLVLLADLWIRSGDLIPHYSDRGVLPLSLWKEHVREHWLLCFHALAGDENGLRLLWAVGYLLAGSLLVGLFSRTAAFACWIYWLSLSARNPIILSGGDGLLRAVLLWCALLPIGDRLSIDAWRAGRPLDVREGRVVVSPGSVIFVLTLVTMYWVSAYWKSNPVWLSEGTALARALDYDLYSTGRMKWLLEHPEPLRWLSRMTVVFELLGPLLVVLPLRSARFRAAAVLAFIGFHGIIAMALELGIFTYTCISAWLAVVPPEVWNRVTGGRTVPRPSEPARHAYEGDLPFTPILRDFAACAVACCMLAYLAHDCCRGCFTLPPSVERIVTLGGFRTRWHLYETPSPLDGWVVAKAVTRGGSEIDLLQGGRQVTWEKPPELSRLHPNHRWRKLVRRLSRPESAPVVAAFLQYLCREAPRIAGERVASVTLVQALELPTSRDKTFRRDVASASCD